MFTKINLALKRAADPAIFKGDLLGNYGSNYFKCPLHYQLIPSTVLSLGPNVIRWVDSSNNLSRAHRHTHETANLNFYIEPDGGLVTFYNTKPTAQHYNEADQPYVDLFSLDDLDYADSFGAIAGDTFLLNVKQPHRVSNIATNSRKYIQVVWRTKSYQQILDELNQI